MQHVLNALDKISALLGQIAGMHPMGGQMHGGRLQAIAADLAAARGFFFPDESASHEAPVAVEDHGHKPRGRRIE